MNSYTKQVLEKIKPLIFENLEPNDITPALVFNNVITQRDYKIILENGRINGREHQVIDFCDIISRKWTDETFPVASFVALLEQNGYKNIADAMSEAHTALGEASSLLEQKNLEFETSDIPEDLNELVKAEDGHFSGMKSFEWNDAFLNSVSSDYLLPDSLQKCDFWVYRGNGTTIQKFLNIYRNTSQAPDDVIIKSSCTGYADKNKKMNEEKAKAVINLTGRLNLIHLNALLDIMQFPSFTADAAVTFETRNQNIRLTRRDLNGLKYELTSSHMYESIPSSISSSFWTVNQQNQLSPSPLTFLDVMPHPCSLSDILFPSAFQRSPLQRAYSSSEAKLSASSQGLQQAYSCHQPWNFGHLQKVSSSPNLIEGSCNRSSKETPVKEAAEWITPEISSAVKINQYAQYMGTQPKSSATKNTGLQACNNKKSVFQSIQEKSPTFQTDSGKCTLCLERKKVSDVWWCPICFHVICSACHIKKHTETGHQIQPLGTLQTGQQNPTRKLERTIQKSQNDAMRTFEDGQEVKDFLKAVETMVLKKIEEVQPKEKIPIFKSIRFIWKDSFLNSVPFNYTLPDTADQECFIWEYRGNGSNLHKFLNIYRNDRKAPCIVAIKADEEWTLGEFQGSKIEKLNLLYIDTPTMLSERSENNLHSVITQLFLLIPYLDLFGINSFGHSVPKLETLWGQLPIYTSRIAVLNSLLSENGIKIITDTIKKRPIGSLLFSYVNHSWESFLKLIHQVKSTGKINSLTVTDWTSSGSGEIFGKFLDEICEWKCDYYLCLTDFTLSQAHIQKLSQALPRMNSVKGITVMRPHVLLSGGITMDNDMIMKLQKEYRKNNVVNVYSFLLDYFRDCIQSRTCVGNCRWSLEMTM